MKFKNIAALLTVICLIMTGTPTEIRALGAEDITGIVVRGTDEHYADYKGIGSETTEEIPGTLGIKTAKDTTLPDGGIGVTYNFNVSEPGTYRLTLAASLHTFTRYLSSYAVSVNGGGLIEINESNAGSSGTPNGGFGASNLIGIYKTDLFYQLHEGVNTVSVYASSLRTEDTRVYYFIEYLDFTPERVLSYVSMPEHIYLFPGGKINAGAECFDGAGQIMDTAEMKLSFKSGDSNIAEVSQTGEIRGISPGETTVTVTAVQGTVEKSFSSLVTVSEDLNIAAVPSKPMGIFTDEDEAEFSLNYSGAFSCSVKDYFGDETDISVTDGKVNAGRLKSGHYTLIVNGLEVTGFSVVRSSKTRRNNDNSPFASDMASVFLVKNQADLPGYARAVYLAGIRQIRERMRWNDACNPSDGAYSFDGHDKFYNAFAEYGIKILNMYHSAPAYTKQNTKLLPDDLTAAYNFAKESAVHYDGIVNMWEIWNEPDIGFTDSSESADKYASLLKAMSIGYRDSGADAGVSLAGIAYEPGAYVENLMKNDVKNYFDIYNYHVHRTVNTGTNINEYPKNSTSHNNFMQEYGISDKPVWVSEAGMFIPFEGESADLTVQQQKASARYLATSAIEGLSQGEDKHFWFILPYYTENNRSLGSFSSKQTPYASYNAAAAVTDALGNGVYEGKIKGLPDTVSGYTFVDGDESVAALWSENEANIRLITNTDTAELTDIMGGRNSLDTDGGVLDLTVGPDIIFVRIGGRFPSRLTGKTDFSKKKEKADLLSANERVVISQTYPESARDDAKNSGYQLDKNAVTYVTADVYNFNSSKTTARITARTYGGWSISPQTVNVALEPNSKAVLTFRISSDGTPVNTMVYPVVIGGRTVDGDISKSVACITSDENTQLTPDVIIEDYKNSDLWRKNAAGGTKQQFTFEGNSVKFSFDFPESVTDRWAYPTLRLSQTQDFSGYDGAVVRVYADAAAAGSVFRMFLTEKSGSSYYTATGYNLEEGWQQFLIPFEAFVLQSGRDENSELDIDEIVSLKAGFNAKETGSSSIILEDMGLYTVSGNKCSGNFESLEYDGGVLTGTLSGALVPYKNETAEVIIGGKVYKAYVSGGIFTCSLPLTAGEYTALARIEDESGAVIRKRITINAQKCGFECGEISIADSDGNEIYTLKNNRYINAKAEVVNVSGTENEFSFTAAVYDADGRLIKAEQNTYSLLENESILAEISADTYGGAYAKIFIWSKNQEAVAFAEFIN